MFFEMAPDGVYYQTDVPVSKNTCCWTPSYGGTWFPPPGNGSKMFCLDGVSNGDASQLLECLFEYHGGAVICGNLVFAGPFLDGE